ncbi:MAG: protein-(glutamine-N5) methyltransferase, release factor-specific [Hyphomicrobiales bacterium]|nr:protein-(glutamine-N5) methyltransferase, release factor-specific [Hyphomicrobiales bacterium]
MLLCAAAGCDHAALIRDADSPLLHEAGERLDAFMQRRLEGEPSTRILGARAFWTLDFLVTPDVLDPRPDSECLIEAALEQLGPDRNKALRILDLGTGTGALLLALLSECPNSTGIGVDLSPAACEVARLNVHSNGLDARAEIRLGRWADGLTGTFDVILSNPPYIESKTIAGLDVEVRNYDPHLALDGGLDGLTAYREIMRCLPGLLGAGFAVLELGIGQAADVTRLAMECGLQQRGLRADLGGVERALVVAKGASAD